MKLLQERLEKFLKKYEDSFDHIIVYVTSKPYRVLVERVAQKPKILYALPKKLQSRRCRGRTSVVIVQFPPIKNSQNRTYSSKTELFI